MEATATQQDIPMQAEPQPEHHWLQRLVGEWTYEGECPGEPGQPPMEFSGTERVRSLGGLWIVIEGHVEMPGCGPATTMMTVGYDPQKQRFVGTWVGSMMAWLWVYDGALDTAERVLSLESEGPHCTEPGQTARYRDAIELESDDHRVMRTSVLGDDGNWQHFMTSHYRRTK